MGGNAIKLMGYEGKRLPKAEYEELVTDVCAKLWISGQFIYALPVRSLNNKEDFGDADILVVAKPNVYIPKVVMELFGAKSITNGECTTFPYKDFQVDIISVADSILDMSEVYFAQNDCGNLCGRIFHALNMKYGHHGLFFKIRKSHIGMYDDSVIKECLLTKNPATALNYVGLSAQRIREGFDSKEDMFRYVCSSPYFSPHFYSYENLNNTNRVRNRKRTVYQDFIEYLNKNYGLDKDQGQYRKLWETKFNREGEFLSIITTFPHLYDEIQTVSKSFIRSAAIKEKFNGEIVIEVTGLTGNALGKFIGDYKKSFDTTDSFEEFILENTLETIKNDIFDFNRETKCSD